jgi:hypothetical protein
MWDNFYIPMKYWAEFFPIIFGFLLLYLSFLNLHGFLRILLFSFNNFICRDGLMFMLVFCKYWQDRIIARLQQPYSLDCIPVEAEYQVGHSMIVCFCNTVDRNFFFFLVIVVFRNLVHSMCEFSLALSAIRAAYIIFLLNQKRQLQQTPFLVK